MYGLKNVRSRRDDALARLGWGRLEVLLADHYRAEGWQVEHVGTAGARSRYDGGIDLKLRRGDAYIVVQCKHWNAKQVPHNEVHQLLGIMVTEGATGAILVTSGEFTRYARESAARSGHVQLIDGDVLRRMLGPLPEAAGPPGPHPMGAMALTVGDRLLRATEDRIRNGGGGRRAMRRAAEATLGGLLLKVALFLIFAWFVVAVIGGALRHALDVLVHPQVHAATSAAPSRASLAQGPRQASTPTASTQASGRGREPIGWRSDTAIEDRPRLLPHRPTAAEIRESQRKADEAAATLAPNTPEM